MKQTLRDYFLIDLLDCIRIRIGEYFQVRFYFYYIFNKKKLIRDIARLEAQNERVKTRHQGKGLRNFLWRHSFKLLCKVNNYTPKP